MTLLPFCAFAAVVVVVLTAPQNSEDMELLQYYSNNDGLGAYSFGYEQSDDSNRNETGELRNAGAENAFVAVKGSFSWFTPEGVSVNVTFIADEKGYQPKIESRFDLGTPRAVVAAIFEYTRKNTVHNQTNP